MRTIAHYPEDFFGDSYDYTENDARIPEINMELPSVSTSDPQAIDIAAMLIWLDKKHNLDNDSNLIVFELMQGFPGLWCLKDFYINVTFCDPLKAFVAQRLNQDWNDMRSRRFDTAESEHRFNLQEDDLYSTDSEVIFARPNFSVDPHRRLYAIPKIIANTRRTIRVTRVPRESTVNVAHTARPDGTRVHIP